MKNQAGIGVLYWLPRVLAIVFVVFLALFALDVFIPGETFWYYAGGLFMHLVPNFVLLGLLGIAWKYEKIGGLLFLLAGIMSVFFFKTYEMLPNFLLVSFPVLFIGSLFLLHNYLDKRKEI